MPEAKRLRVTRVLKRCPSCRYARGFHLMLRRKAGDAHGFRAFLICPSCATVYDPGLRLEAIGKE